MSLASGRGGVLRHNEEYVSFRGSIWAIGVGPGISRAHDPVDLARFCVVVVEGVSLLNRVQDGPDLSGSVKRALLGLLDGDGS